VRDRVSAGLPLSGFVPSVVAEIISARGLYRHGGGSGSGGIIGRG
jgi:hypothetical protein